jgi:hypothetical protein
VVRTGDVLIGGRGWRSDVLARVMTFSAGSDVLDELVDTLRREVGGVYEGIRGFRGMLAVKNVERQHVIAITLWEDQEGIDASAMLAETVVDRIARHTQRLATHYVYEVIGDIGLLR